ncbi:MAG: tetratricopeptide repeat protein [Bacteroidia bacterium]|nr:tetratricopeptide repeat protein [Bacteroidia bacterium]
MNIIKRYRSNIFIPVILCMALCSSCTEGVYFNVTEPAYVTIPNGVKRVGIVNRSIISDSNNVRRSIDNIISEKSPLLDKECSMNCISGLKAALIQSNIFPKVESFDSLHLINSHPNAFPAPLPWTEIEKICSNNKVDVLFSLELFHTDTKVNVVGSAMTLLNAGPDALAGSGTEGTIVKTGWRIYYPQSRSILDEYTLGNNVTSSLMNHKETIRNTSYDMGQTYASRVIPTIVSVWRDFYIRGNRNFKIARRMADAGDWNSAAKIWQNEINNPKRKLCARAYYDLAINQEINGNLDSAIGFAQKSYEIGGRQLALDYLNMLQNRVAGNQILNSQAH